MGSFTNWIANTFYGADTLTAESAAIDAKREALNRQSADAYGPAWYEQTQRNDATGTVNATQDIANEFKPGALADNLKESAAGTAGSIRDFLAPVLEFPLRIIPPIGWVILAVALFVYLGGLAYLRRVIAAKG